MTTTTTAVERVSVPDETPFQRAVREAGRSSTWLHRFATADETRHAARKLVTA